MDYRHERVEKLLTDEIGRFLGTISNRTSLITVTRVTVSGDGRTATVFLSVLPDDHTEEAVAFVKRRLSDLREDIAARTKVRPVPFFDVAVDSGLASS